MDVYRRKMGCAKIYRGYIREHASRYSYIPIRILRRLQGKTALSQTTEVTASPKTQNA
jgi:hypothetical protein